MAGKISSSYQGPGAKVATSPGGSGAAGAASIVDGIDELDLCFQVLELYNRAKRRLDRRHEKWRRSYRIVHNRPYGQSNALGGASAPTASEVFPILSALVGWMTDQRTRFEAMAAAESGTPYADQLQQMAHDLGTLLDAIWLNQLCDREVEHVLWDANIYGIGYFKCVWDTAADYGAGNATMYRVDPFAIYPDPAAHNMDDMNYIVEARYMSVTEIERRWPDKVGQLTTSNETGDNLPKREDMLESDVTRAPMSNPGGIHSSQGTGKPVYGLPGQSRVRGIDQEGGMVVYECWIKENVPFKNHDDETYYVPSWRVLVVTSDVLLMDERAEDLWGHGCHPYVRYVTNDLGEFYGPALVEHLAPAQLAINRLLAAMQAHAELCGNPVMLEDARSGVPRTKIVNQPGQRITKTAGSEVGWMTPPDMPQGVPNLVTFWVNEMERISGLSAMVRGATPTGRNAQGVLDSVQESAFVRVRLAMRNLEYALAQAGNLMASLITENYTEPRVTAIVGPSGQRTTLALQARHFYSPNEQGGDPMRFSVWVSAGSQNPISRSARAAEADALFAMQAIDTKAVLDAHDFPNRDLVEERMNALQGMQLPGGAPDQRNRPR